MVTTGPRTRRNSSHQESAWDWRKPARVLVRVLAAQSVLSGLASVKASSASQFAPQPSAPLPLSPAPQPSNVLPPAPSPAAPSLISAPANAWTWVPFNQSQCADGSATGLGVSLAEHPTADTRLVLYLQGGGRCDSKDSCQGPEPSAVNLHGFAAEAFQTQLAEDPVQTTALFNRTDPTNPVANDHFIFVPYCTGDDHSGDNQASYGAQHRGYRNMGYFLERLVPTFTHVNKVLLTGSSAGGSGAFWNFYRVQQAFGQVPVTLLDDAGPFLGNPVVEFNATSVSEWNLAGTVPSGCNQCIPNNSSATNLLNFYAFFTKALPNARAALLTSSQDEHVSARDQLNGSAFESAIERLSTSIEVSAPLFQFFVVDDSRHTWLGGINGTLSTVTAHNTTLSDFLQQQLDLSPKWRSAGV